MLGTRVLVVGMTGAGKTTAARRIADRIGAPFHEMDVLAIGPNWSTRPDLVAQVAALLETPAWVFDSYGYDQVRDAMWAAADTIVWLDYPARVIVPRVVRRSLSRSFRRAEIFGGNRETWAGWLRPEHPVWWAIRTLRRRRAYLAERTQSAGAAHLRTVRLTSPAEFERWLAAQ
jgi:adenylate kinase family enzyme